MFKTFKTKTKLSSKGIFTNLVGETIQSKFYPAGNLRINMRIIKLKVPPLPLLIFYGGLNGTVFAMSQKAFNLIKGEP